MIQICQYLVPERIIISQSGSRDSVLNELVDCVASTPAIDDADQLRQALFEREALCSTGIGLGLAVPHVRLASVREMTMAAALLTEPIDFNSLDAKGVRLVFLVASPINSHRDYLRILAKIALIARNEPKREQMFAAQSPQAIWDLLQELD